MNTTLPGPAFSAIVVLRFDQNFINLRHLPADLYWGWGASTREWASRLLQLATISLIFGWIRHRSGSTASTWVAHLLLWMAVIVIN